jgi:hypothetical protein
VLEPGRDGVEVFVPGHATQPLAGAADVELALGSAIGRYLSLADSRSGDAPEFEQVELIPRTSGAILTREEIDAFRD